MEYQPNYQYIAFWLGVVLAYWFARKKELPSPALSIFIGALIGRIVGATAAGLTYALLHLHWVGPEEASENTTFLELFQSGTRMGGLASLAAGGLACILYWRLIKRPISEYLRVTIPALAVATAFARVGCWLTVDFDMGPPAPFSAPPITAIGGTGDFFYTHDIPLWNLPLLEVLVYLAYAERSRKIDYLNSLAFFLFFYSSVNFALEFSTWSLPLDISYSEILKYSPRHPEDVLNPSWNGLTYKQALSIIIGVPSLLLFFVLKKIGARRLTAL